ncbi:MAG: MFS transporter, partial [Caldilineaceae bacterium]|nr:MFS transporter [Caldilineaceae bacterium]
MKASLLRNPLLMPVYVPTLIIAFGRGMLVPILPLYAASFGANALLIGLLSGAYPVMQFLAAPMLGRLSDRFGRKPVLPPSQIGTFGGFVLMGVANALPLLLLARLIDGISGANISTAQAVLTDSTTEKNRTQALGL